MKKMAEKQINVERDEEDHVLKNHNASKKNYHQSFHQEYKTLYPALRSSAKGPQFAHCTVCKSEFSVAHDGGKNDCKKH